MDSSIYLMLMILLTLGISAFFSGTEIAYISADRMWLTLKTNNTRKGTLIEKLYENPSLFLGTMLVGNNIALVIFGTLMEAALQSPINNLLPAWLSNEFTQLLSITLVSTIIVLLFGEFIPKVIFRLNALNIIQGFARPLTNIKFLLNPLAWLMVSLSEGILKLLKVGKQEDLSYFTRLNLEHFIKNINEGTKDEINTEMFGNALYLSHTKIKECMIPKADIKAIEINKSILELKEQLIETKHSRIIVYQGTLDNIVGYTHHLHLLQEPESIQDIIIDLLTVQENMAAKALMNKMIAENKNIAIVKNRALETVGLITLENILEEIFGEIEDEHD